jgi:hypothetical protein
MCRGWGLGVSSSELTIQMSIKTRSNLKDVREDDACRWKGLDKDSCASLPDVV